MKFRNLFLSLSLLLVSGMVSAQGSNSDEISISAEAESMFELAAEVFPNLFTNGSELRVYQEYVYRFYAASGIYVGIKDGVVYAAGGPFGSALKTAGPVTAVFTALLQAKEAAENAPEAPDDTTEVDLGDVDAGDLDPDISGLYDLTISGTIATVVGGFAAPGVAFNLTINDIVAPNPNDTGEITNVISETLSNVSGVSELEIVVTNNTENRVTFTVSFTAMQSGLTVNMELEYDYIR